MHDNEKEKFLEKVFFEIKKGFSQSSIEGVPFFIKHATMEETQILNKYYDYFFEKARKLGVPKEEGLMKTLEDQGVWSKKDEDILYKLKDENKNLQKTFNNMVIERDKEPIKKRIDELQKLIKKKKKERESVVTNTAEDYASKKSTEKFLYYCLFKDEDLKEKLFTKEEFEEIGYSELSEIYVKYNEAQKKFEEKNLKQLSITPIFKSIYNLYSEDLTGFFKKHPLDLSFFQVNLLNYAKLFTSIFKNHKIPDNIRNDAQKILDFIEEDGVKKKQVEKAIDKANESDGFSYARAKDSDLEKLGVNKKGTKDIHKVAEEAGGELSMEDFMKIHKK